MKIALTGASGFIGKRVQIELADICDEFLILSRTENLETWKEKIYRADIIINLAGSPILCRWSKTNRSKIMNSRIKTTAQIVDILNNMPVGTNPKLFLSASAIGIYPDDISMKFDEDSIQKGSGFLADVVSRWEAEAMRLSNSNVRLVIMRLGVVLGKESAMIKQLLPLFRLGLGGAIGNGKQMMSFIHVNDLIKAIRFLMLNQEIKGVVNLVAPNAISNRQFTKVLARIVNRSAFFSVPSMVLKMIYGHAASILIKGSAVYPKRLIERNFEFEFPSIEKVLTDICN